MTKQQRDRLAYKRQKEKEAAHIELAKSKQEWHRWFAWRPVRDKNNGYRMWLEFVLRRTDFYEKWHPRLWEYRPITFLPSDIGVAVDE